MGDDLKNSSLTHLWNEKNPWFYAVKNYSLCYDRYYKVFDTKALLEEELKRSDINTVCKKEMLELKRAAPTINYKEILGTIPFIITDSQE